MGKKCIVISSGGLDSSTALYIAKDKGYEIYSLTFQYGQRHILEVECAKTIAQIAKVKEHRIINLPVPKGSALTDNIDIPKGRNLEELSIEIPPTYVPARNTLFIAYALQYAEEVGAEAIYIGLTAVDASPYPDTRPEYVDAWQHLINKATKQTVLGKTITLEAPLLHLYKSEIVEIGIELGVPYDETWSCYSPMSWHDVHVSELDVIPNFKYLYVPCLECDTCKLRSKGFIEAGYADPLIEKDRWDKFLEKWNEKKVDK